MLLTPVLTFFGGKGGVGKTTMAAAYAVGLADAGHRTLVLSTDPAHSLGDALEVEVGDEPVQVVPDLWVRQPDPAAAVQRRIAQVTEDAYAAVPREIMPAVERHLALAAGSPGMAESALADQLIEAMAEVPGRWDRLVIDSPPTGHLLRLLALPGLLAPWVSGLTRQREKVVQAERFASAVAGSGTEEGDGPGDDPLLRTLHARRRRLEAAAERMRGPQCQVRLVLVPRRMVLAETLRAVEELTGAGFGLGAAVLNQVPQDPDRDVLDRVRETFAPHGLVEIPEQPREPTGLAALRQLAPRLADR